MENDEGVKVDLYIPRKWYNNFISSLFPILNILSIQKNKNNLALTLTASLRQRIMLQSKLTLLSLMPTEFTLEKTQHSHSADSFAKREAEMKQLTD